MNDSDLLFDFIRRSPSPWHAVKTAAEALEKAAEEMALQEAGWRAWSAAHIPPAFEGMDELLRRYRERDGAVCVVSHSSEETIQRDYRQHFGFEPDLVFGWELGADKRKPAPWPLEQIMKHSSLEPRQLLMVDDLKPADFALR